MAFAFSRVLAGLFGHLRPRREPTPERNDAAIADLEHAVRAVVDDPDALAHLPEMVLASSTPQELIAELHDNLSRKDYDAVAVWLASRRG